MNKQRLATSFLILSLILFGASCSGNGRVSKQPSGETTAAADSLAFPLEVNYAKGFSIENLEGGKRISLLDVSSGDTLQRYLLLPRGVAIDSSLIRASDQIIRTPIRSLVSLSSTLVGALEELNLRHLLVGGSNINTYYDEAINARVDSGLIIEVGRAMGVNYESVVAARPDLVMQSYIAPGDKLPDFEKLGIALVQNNDWLEISLLARAEWIKLVGILVGHPYRADSIFHAAATRYQQIIESHKPKEPHPTVLFGQDFRGVWYMPSSNSYVAEMLTAAGGKYDAPSDGVRSLPLSFEQVYATHYNDAFWFAWNSTMVGSLDEFLQQNPRYAQFRAFREGNIFLNDKRSRPNGANDYWERAPYHPDRLLQDLIDILYPTADRSKETSVYWRQLKHKK